MSKTKILHIAKWYPNKEEPLLGIFVRKHLLASQKEFDNTVLSIYQTNNISVNIKRVEANTKGVDEVVFYYRNGLINKAKVLYCVYKEIKKHRDTKLIHSHIMGWSTSIAYLASIISNKDFLVTEHWTGYRKGHYNQLSVYTKALRRLVARKAKIITVVSEFLKKDMLSCKLKGNYTILENVVDGVIPNNKKNDLFTFLFVGDLDEEHKNVSGILRSFSDVVKTNKNVRLDILGEGKDGNVYKDLTHKLQINDFVRFLGYKNNKEVFEYLSKSHGLVLNSNFETFSIICAEALLCGIPVISTKCGGPESFLNEQTGYLIDIGSDKQLTKAMINMLNHSNNFNKDQLIATATKFSEKEISKKLRSIYASLLDNSLR